MRVTATSVATSRWAAPLMRRRQGAFPPPRVFLAKRDQAAYPFRDRPAAGVWRAVRTVRVPPAVSRTTAAELDPLAAAGNAGK